MYPCQAFHLTTLSLLIVCPPGDCTPWFYLFVVVSFSFSSSMLLFCLLLLLFPPLPLFFMLWFCLLLSPFSPLPPPQCLLEGVGVGGEEPSAILSYFLFYDVELEYVPKQPRKDRNVYCSLLVYEILCNLLPLFLLSTMIVIIIIIIIIIIIFFFMLFFFFFFFYFFFFLWFIPCIVYDLPR